MRCERRKNIKRNTPHGLFVRFCSLPTVSLRRQASTCHEDRRHSWNGVRKAVVLAVLVVVGKGAYINFQRRGQRAWFFKNYSFSWVDVSLCNTSVKFKYLSRGVAGRGVATPLTITQPYSISDCITYLIRGYISFKDNVTSILLLGVSSSMKHSVLIHLNSDPSKARPDFHHQREGSSFCICWLMRWW
jgi:hypothetical protein